MKKLEDLPKKEPFKAPDNYFESFPFRMQQRVSQLSTEKKPAIYQNPVFKYSLAFVLIISLAFVLTLYKGKNSNNPDNWLSKVSDEELLFYLKENNYQFDDFFHDETDIWNQLLDEENELMELETLKDDLLEKYLEQLDFEINIDENI